VAARGVVDRVEPARGGALLTIRPAALSERDDDLLRTFHLHRVSLPFVVFLSAGAISVILWGDAIARFLLETWPRFVTGR
jgi:prepilin signal peptidase PulO-like enzyme (type II secretory pathway)